jgi:hypothetical protein
METLIIGSITALVDTHAQLVMGKDIWWSIDQRLIDTKSDGLVADTTRIFEH